MHFLENAGFRKIVDRAATLFALRLVVGNENAL
jgi:hypothetical protein